MSGSCTPVRWIWNRMRMLKLFLKPWVLQQNKLSVIAKEVHSIFKLTIKKMSMLKTCHRHMPRGDVVSVSGGMFVCSCVCLGEMMNDWSCCFLTRPLTLTRSVGVQHNVLHCHIPLTLGIWHGRSPLWVIPSSQCSSYFFCEYTI